MQNSAPRLLRLRSRKDPRSPRWSFAPASPRVTTVRLARRAKAGDALAGTADQRAGAAVAERTVSEDEKTTKPKISTAAATISEPIATTGSTSGWPPASIQ